MNKIKQFFFSKQWVWLILTGIILSLLLAVFTQAYLGSFSRYLADDFCTSGKLKELGFWGSQQFWYTHWSGRFSFTFLVNGLEQLGTTAPAYLPAVYCLLLLVSAYTLIAALVKRISVPVHPIIKILFAAYFSFLLLYGIPGIGQDLYWMTGAATYLAPIVVGLFLFALLITLSNPGRPLPTFLRWIFIPLTLLLALVNSGFSEVITVLQATILILAVLYQKWLSPHKKWDWLWLTALAVTLIGMAVMILAPGNTNRQASYPDHPNLINLVFLSVKYAGTYILLWLMKNTNLIWPGLILLSAASLMACQKLPPLSERQRRTLETIYLMLSVLLFALVFLSFVPSTWATSQGAEDRVLILPSVFLTLFALLSGAFFGVEFSTYEKQHPLGSKAFSGFFILLFAGISLHFILAVPLYQAREVYSQKGEAAAFARAWDEREAAIQAQLDSGANTLEVPMIGSNLMGLEHIQNDPGHWINICAAEHYQVESIQTTQP